MAFNPKAVKGYNKRYKQLQGPRAVRRVRARVPTRSYGRTHVRTFNPKAHRQRTPRRVKRQVRAKVHKAHPTRFGKTHVRLLPGEKIHLGRHPAGFSKALAEHGLHPHFDIGKALKDLASHNVPGLEAPQRPGESPAGKIARELNRHIAKPSVMPHRLSEAPAVKGTKALGKAIGFNQPRLPGDQLTVVQPGSAVDKAVRKQLGPKGFVPKEGHKLAKTVRKLDNNQPGRQQAGLPAGKVLGEAVDLFASTPASTYATAQAVQEAASGKPQKLHALTKQYSKTSALSAALSGHPAEAAKRFGEHPVASTLEITGAGGAISRTAGRTARLAPKGTTLERVGSRERAPKIAPGTPIRIKRQYSPGLLGKGAQVLHERARATLAKRHYEKAAKLQAQGKEGPANHALRSAERHDPLRASEKDLKKRYDVREAVAEPRRRAHRTRAVSEANKALDVKHPDVALLLAQHIVKPTRESLAAYRDQIAAHIKSGKLEPAERASAKRLHRQVDTALQDKNLDLSAHAEAGKAYAKVVVPRQKKLVQKKILPAAQERMAKLVPVARQEMGAVWNPPTRQLEVPRQPLSGDAHATLKSIARQQAKRKRQSPGGTHAIPLPEQAARELAQPGPPRKLSVQEIEAHLRQTGRSPEDVAYVSHKPSAHGPGSYFRAWQRPVEVSGPSRTGEAVARGTHAVSKEVGRSNAAAMQSLIDAHDEYAGFLKENAYREGKAPKTFRSRQEGEKFIRNLAAQRLDKPGLHPATYKWKLVPLRPTFGRAEHARQLLHDASAEVDARIAVHDGLTEALNGKGPDNVRWAAVPETVAKQQQDHLNVLDPTAFGKGSRLAMQAFRGAVLATSPTWITGNIVEAALRSLVAKAGPESYALGKATLARLHEIHPAMAEEMLARIGSGHFGMQELQVVHTTAEAFRDTAAEPIARLAGTARRTPPVKQAADLWKLYTHVVFDVNSRLEKQFKIAMLGRHVQDVQLRGNALGNWDKAVDQAARGLTNTNEQAQAADFVRRAYGRYEAWTPNQRRLIAQYTPFLAWTLNAYKFLFSVLPRDHPALTGALAIQHQATQEWRNAHGRGQGSKIPGFLKTTIPVKGGSIPAGRYTPFGVIGDPLGGASSLVMPQASGALMAMQGLDWKGKPLGGYRSASQVPDGVKAQAAGQALLEASVPLIGLSSRIRQYGPVQGLNPVRKIKKRPAKGKKKVKKRTPGYGVYGGGPPPKGGWGNF